MMNYAPRFLIESENDFALLDNKPAVDRLLAGLDSTGITVTDRALTKRASTSEGAWHRGYYDIRYMGSDILSYIEGQIARSADKALDRLDDLSEQIRVDFERRHSIVEV